MEHDLADIEAFAAAHNLENQTEAGNDGILYTHQPLFPEQTRVKIFRLGSGMAIAGVAGLGLTVMTDPENIGLLLSSVALSSMGCWVIVASGCLIFGPAQARPSTPQEPEFVNEYLSSTQNRPILPTIPEHHTLIPSINRTPKTEG